MKYSYLKIWAIAGLFVLFIAFRTAFVDSQLSGRFGVAALLVLVSAAAATLWSAYNHAEVTWGLGFARFIICGAGSAVVAIFAGLVLDSF